MSEDEGYDIVALGRWAYWARREMLDQKATLKALDESDAKLDRRVSGVESAQQKIEWKMAIVGSVAGMVWGILTAFGMKWFFQ